MRVLIATILVLILPITLSAQKYGMSSAGPIPKLKLETTPIKADPSQSPLWETAFGYSNSQSYILSMPIPEGTPLTLLSQWDTPYGYFASSMGMTPFGGPGYITVWTDWPGHPQQIYKMDHYTGAVTFAGNITSMGSDYPVAIAYNHVNTHFYIISFTNLYSFDPCTLTATLIGPLNSSGYMIAFCFDIYGVCYAYNLTDDNAYTINISTGNATLLGPLGYDAAYGQGMSYDYYSNTIYLSAFNYGTFSGQLRTMDPATGMTSLITDWGYEQIAPFAIDGNMVCPCWLNFDPPADPNPPNGTIGVNVSGTTLNWLNSEGTNSVELYFGPRDSVTKVYDGPAITSWQTGGLKYHTDYFWHVVSKDPCAIHSPVWNFTSENPPGMVFYEDFFDLTSWTWIGPEGQENWTLVNSNNAAGTPPELRCYTLPTYVGLNQQLSSVINSSAGHTHEFRFRYKYYWNFNPAPAHGLAITYDNGATSTSIWEETPVGNIGPEEVIFHYTPASDSFRLILYNNGNSNNFWVIYYDDFQVTDLNIIPVELASYTAELKNDIVELNWKTVTECNNKGFEIYRKTKCTNWSKIGFIAGKGTTSEPQSYSFTDNIVTTGSYSYRLKQIDFNGAYKYSNTIDVDIKLPIKFALEQNYPNPFNPVTTIKFSIPKEVTVNLSVYNILGEQVKELKNEVMKPGYYEVEFSAAALSSGVYFYKIKAGDFVQTKKMLLIK